MPNEERRSRLRSGALLALSLVLSLTEGCGNLSPCLAYAPQLYTRSVSMRGYGSVEITEEKMVCTARAGELAATP